MITGFFITDNCYSLFLFENDRTVKKNKKRKKMNKFYPSKKWQSIHVNVNNKKVPHIVVHNGAIRVAPRKSTKYTNELRHVWNYIF